MCRCRCKAGEILGIYGLMGAGRSELFDCIMGRHGQATGKIFIDGEEVRERDTTRRIRRGLALIPEDRQREGLVPILSVASNLTLASLRKFANLFHIARRHGAQGRRPRWSRNCRSRSRTPTTK